MLHSLQAKLCFKGGTLTVLMYMLKKLYLFYTSKQARANAVTQLLHAVYTTNAPMGRQKLLQECQTV